MPANGCVAPHTRFCTAIASANDLASPVQVGAHRLQEEAEAVAHAHGERQDEAAADEDDGRGAPIGAWRWTWRTRCAPRIRCQRPRPPGSGCSASMSRSVAISASSLSAPIVARDFRLRARQWGCAAPSAFSPARVSDTSRVRASRPGAIVDEPALGERIERCATARCGRAAAVSARSRQRAACPRQRSCAAARTA